MLTETEKAYLAGIIDGEGCITITKKTRGSYQLVLVVAMTSFPVISYVAQLLEANARGGKVTSTGKQVYQVMISGYHVKEILEEIEPYIIGKTRQVFLAYQFPLGQRGNSHSVSPGMMEDRELIAHEMWKYNKQP